MEGASLLGLLLLMFALPSPAGAALVGQAKWGGIDTGPSQFRNPGQVGIDSAGSTTVRGTKWLTADRCDGTLVRVTQGVIAVRDLVRKKTVVLRKGKSYFARAKR
jgi:hypothetical protein